MINHGIVPESDSRSVRICVCGGRDYNDASCVASTLTAHQPSVIIEGGASGADKLSHDWAYRAGVRVETFHANWRAHGRGAGPIRNQRMIDEGKPDMVVAFPGGRGTADMVRRAKAAGIEVREITA